jgi:hypothetical protein
MGGLTITPNYNLSAGDPSFYPYSINYSCRFNDDDSAALDVAAAPAMDDAKIFTFSCWFKRGNLGISQYILSGGVDSNNGTSISINSNNKLNWFHADAGGVTDQMLSTAVYRDTTQWYHLLCVYNSTEAAAGDRQRAWINGSEITAWDIEDQAALNATCDFGGNLLNVGCRMDSAVYFDGYLAEMYFIDGTVYATTDFGETKNGIWIPKDPGILTYGTAGFYLDFANSADFGSDQSGNSNDFTDVNLAAADQVLDTPTENYCVLNLLDKSLSGMTLSEGNLKGTAGAAQDGVRGTFAIPSSGKWYFEITCSNSGWYGGIANQDLTLDGDTGDDADACTFLDNSTTAYIESANQAAYWVANPAGNVVGVCVNMDDLEIHFTNAAEGEQTAVSFGATAGDTWFPYGGGNSDNATFNFGQSGFTLTPPGGYLALNTRNIAEIHNYSLKIMNPSEGVNAVTYAGDDGATQAITGVGFQPDFVWIKNRSQADAHYLCDSVRGATKYLSADANTAETTDANDGIQSFDSDGFTVMYNADDIVNAAGENYISWSWIEDPDYGFDIVQNNCTGNNEAINHNLGAAPELIIAKSMDDAESWFVYHHYAFNKTDPETDYGVLNINNAWADSATIWNDTAPTSTQFTVGTEFEASDYIFYLFRSIEGFSKVFSYEGNNNADGPFVYCGFRPKMVILKNVDAAASAWGMFDAVRNTYNPIDRRVYPDVTDAEATATTFDIVSNGFKSRAVSFNAANTYVGIAFADLPGIYSNAF